MIPLVKPYLPPRYSLIPALSKTLYSGYIAEGKQVYQFEDQLSILLDTKYIFTTNSGTAALHIALTLIGVSNGDEIISTALTAEPTNTTISLTGAKIVFADVNKNNGLIDPISIRSKITSKTKAIMIVHYAGMVCDLEEIQKISIEYNLPVIEDAAHSFLAEYKGKKIGSFSRFTCFSFQAIKHLTTGDGGAISFKYKDDYDKGKLLRWFGLDKKLPREQNNIVKAGFKYHMNNINATIGLVQLKYLKQNTLKYIENGNYLDKKLVTINNPKFKLPEYTKNSKPSFWLYTIIVEDREKLINIFRENGITASPLHKRNDLHSVFQPNSPLPNLDLFYPKLLHLPVGWWVKKSKLNLIISIIKKGW